MSVHILSEEAVNLDCVDSIFEEIQQKNKVSKEQWDKEVEEEKVALEKSYEEYPVSSILENCHSKDMFDAIKKQGWQINRYLKLNQQDKNGEYYCYDEILEKYECSHNGWRFTVNYLQDCDIEDGIWSVYSAENENNGEKADFYFDLGCRNTSEEKLERFNTLLSCNSIKEYVRDVFGKYLAIPVILSSYGFHVEAEEPIKDENIISLEHIVYKVEKRGDICYLVVFKALYDDIKFVVTNDKKWDVNSSNKTLGNKIAYYLDYNGPEDEDALCEAIILFNRHMHGEIGFFEDGNYITNYAISEYFKNLRNLVPHDVMNHYHMRVKYNDIWDMRGYCKESRMPNLSTGLEVYSEVEVVFNDAAQWSEGDTAYKLVFVYKYETKDKNVMHLHVYGHSFDNSSYGFEFKDKDLQDEWAENGFENSWQYAKLDIDEEYVGLASELMEITMKYLRKAACYFNISNAF